MLHELKENKKDKKEEEEEKLHVRGVNLAKYKIPTLLSQLSHCEATAASALCMALSRCLMSLLCQDSADDGCLTASTARILAFPGCLSLSLSLS